jgi:hypothetical protein
VYSASAFVLWEADGEEWGRGMDQHPDHLLRQFGEQEAFGGWKFVVVSWMGAGYNPEALKTGCVLAVVPEARDDEL